MWALLTNRFVLGGAAALFLFASISLGWQWGLAKKAAREANDNADRLELSIEAPVTGFRARLATCEASLAGARISIDSQNDAIDEVIRTADEAKARAEARIKAAEQKARVAQRQIEDIRDFQAEGNETQCEAAFRLHQETIR